MATRTAAARFGAVGQRQVTMGMITHRMASEHVPSESTRSAAGSPKTSERGLAERASHLTCHTRKPRDTA
jgi:hypothetical protein